MKAFKIYVLPVCLVCLSIIFQFLSETQILDRIVSSLFVESKAKDARAIITILSYVFFVVPLGWQSVTRGCKADLCETTVTKYIDEQRELLSSILQSNKYVNATAEDINVRVFRKRFNTLVLTNEDRFYSRRIAGKLSFSISKNQGLCSQSYNKRRSMLEMEDASKPEYNLTERQKALAGNLKFIVAVPIHPDGNGKIKYVICFDSFKRIAKPGCEQGILKQCESIAYTIGTLIDS